MTTMTTDIDTKRPILGATVFDPRDRQPMRQVVATPNGLLPDPGMFVIEGGWGATTYYPGCTCANWTFGRFTGRTWRRWGYDCPTIERYEVDTVVLTDQDGNSAIWGVPGVRIPGTLATRPENLR